MALITCPECGRDNVSDSAIACPGCGFGIKEYYDAIREQKNIEKEKSHSEYADSVVRSLENDIKMHQERREKILAQQKKEEQKSFSQKIQSDHDNKEDESKENNKIDTVRQNIFIDELERTRNWNFYFIFLNVLFLLTYSFMLLVSCSAGFMEDALKYGFLTALLLCLFIILYKRGKKIKNDIEAAKKGVLKYDMEIVNRGIKRSKQLAEAMAIAEKQEKERLANNVPCPVCKSRDTYRISTLNRATSVAVFGLASGKIGKQYKCNNCGHLW